jgi:hypothetical protein
MPKSLQLLVFALLLSTNGVDAFQMFFLNAAAAVHPSSSMVEKAGTLPRFIGRVTSVGFAFRTRMGGLSGGEQTKSKGGGEKKAVLFVCLGNICRSPAAEAVFRSVVKVGYLPNGLVKCQNIHVV